MPFCGYCGSNMPDDMKFCTKCGKPLFVATDKGDEIVSEGNYDSSLDMNDSDMIQKLQSDQQKVMESGNVTNDFDSINLHNTIDTGSFERYTGVVKDASVDRNFDDLYLSLKANAERNSRVEKKKSTIPLTLTLICVLLAILFIVGKTRSSRTSISDAPDTTNSFSQTATIPASSNSVTSTTSNSNSSTTNASTTSSNSGSSVSTESSVTVERRERDGSSMRQHDFAIAFCRISTPLYWTAKSEGTASRIDILAESGNKMAGITIQATTDNNGDYSWVKDPNKRDLFVSERSNAFFGDYYISSLQYYETSTVAGFLGNITADEVSGHSMTGKIFLVPSKDYKRMVIIALLQTDNTQYLYNEEFMRIIDTIELLDGTWPVPN